MINCFAKTFIFTKLVALIAGTEVPDAVPLPTLDVNSILITLAFCASNFFFSDESNQWDVESQSHELVGEDEEFTWGA